MPTKKKTSRTKKSGGAKRITATQKQALQRHFGGSITMGPSGRIYAGGAWWNNWGDLWSGVKDVAKKGWDFVKENKLVSKGLKKFVPEVMGVNVGEAAEKLGLGKRKRGGQKMMVMVPAIRV